MKQDFSIHGCRLQITTDSTPISELVLENLKPYLTDTSETPLLRMNLADLETSRPPRDPFSISRTFQWIRSRTLWGDSTPFELWITDGVSVARVDYRSRSAAYWVSRDTLGDAPFFIRTFLWLPLLELLRTEGLFYMHGAVLQNGKHAILVLGPGGSGKSTTALALLRNGWRVVCDDNLLLREQPDGIVKTLPFEQELSFHDPGGLPTPMRAGARFNRGKWRLSLSSLATAHRADFAVPRTIILLEPGPEDQVHPTSRSMAFDKLVRENPLVLAIPSLAADHTRTLQTLLQQSQILRMTLRRSPELNLDDLAVRLEQLLAQTGSGLDPYQPSH